MTVIKQYNSGTSTWETIVVGKQGPTGPEGGTSTLTTKGDILTRSSSALARLPVGTDNYVLRASASETNGLLWSEDKSYTRHGCVISHNANQAIANVTTTQLSFNTEDLDTDGFHSTSTNTPRITIPTGLAGVYVVSAYVRWESTTVTGPYLLIQKNGNAVARALSPSAAYVSQNVTWVGYLAASDYVTVAVYHSSGVNKNVDYLTASALDPLSPQFSAFRLGGIA